MKCPAWMSSLLLGGLLLTAAFAPTQPDEVTAREPRKLALLVGISNYFQLGARPWRRLNTADDLTQLRQVLIAHYGFQERDIRMLRDDQATTENIRQTFRSHLIDQAGPADVVFFHFSGHGQQILDDNGDEMDGLDESLVTYDAQDRAASAGAVTNIRDDELGRWLGELQARMRVDGKLSGTITVSLDSCFSGTATRGILNERGRGWEPQLDGPKPEPRPAGTRDDGIGLLPAGEAARLGYVVLAAAQSDQTAKEADGMGVFTRALVRTLAATYRDDRMTYRALMDRVAADVASVVPEQAPQVEGAADTLLFSGLAESERRPLAAIRVSIEPSGVLRLQAGELHGVSRGSVFALHSLGCPKLDVPSLLGEAVVEEVELLRATLRPRASGDLMRRLAAEKGALAVELEHAFSDAPLRLHWEGGEACKELRAQLRGLDVLTEQGGSATDYDLQIACDQLKQRIEVRRSSSAVPLSVQSMTPDGMSQIQELMKATWRWRYLTKLRQDNPQALVRLRLIPVDAQEVGGKVIVAPKPRPSESPRSHLVLRSGEHFMLEFTNASDSPLYVTVLELVTDGSINVPYPAPEDQGNNKIAADSQPHVPPWSPYVYRVDDRPGQRSLLKVIATREPLNLSSIVQSALQQRTRTANASIPVSGPLSPLARLLASLAAGQRSGSAPVAPEVWGTSEAWLEVVPQ